MSKIQNSILDNISENNNDYRVELRNLNNKIDESTTAMVGDIVSLSEYKLDFSNAIASAKDELVSKISRIIESCVIRDLRGVESVNEQFLDKINDKLENADVQNDKEKEEFVKGLNTLLGDKYLEIVKIKRIEFFDEDGTNQEIENVINDYKDNLIKGNNIDELKLSDLLSSYKTGLYQDILKSFSKINSLYQNNFVNGITNALSSAIDYVNKPVVDTTDEDMFKPYIPDINPVGKIDIPIIPEIPVETENVVSSNINNESQSEIPAFTEHPFLDIPEIPVIPQEELKDDDSSISDEEIKPIIDEPIASFEKVPNMDMAEDNSKKSYDVEEILKIAKSPVASMPIPELNEFGYEKLEPIKEDTDSDTLDSEFNEEEIVNEMINRLNNRLLEIKTRQDNYLSEKNQLDEDESFVNDLIASSNNKKDELDKFELELDEKEKELNEKEKELQQKINNVLPFANAVLQADK